jgi:hypothetical protein
MITSASFKKSPLKFYLLVFALSIPFWLIGAENSKHTSLSSLIRHQSHGLLLVTSFASSCTHI